MNVDYLKSIRKREKFTQREMAYHLHISYSHYTKVEGGYVKPSFDVLKRIYDVFNNIEMENFFK